MDYIKDIDMVRLEYCVRGKPTVVEYIHGTNIGNMVFTKDPLPRKVGKTDKADK